MTASAAAKPVSKAEGQAQGSSFYSAMRLLPKPERAAMFAIYAFCREVDDIADEKGPTPEERCAQLDVWRRAVDSLYTASPTARMRDLAGPTRHYKLEKEDFLAVIDGMEMDVGEPMRRPPFEVLDLYCDRVASAVGRLSVKVFGMEEEPGKQLAYHLGRALQFTNILRDLDEDAAVGRLYRRAGSRQNRCRLQMAVGQGPGALQGGQRGAEETSRRAAARAPVDERGLSHAAEPDAEGRLEGPAGAFQPEQGRTDLDSRHPRSGAVNGRARP
jgi:hypothetical protein